VKRPEGFDAAGVEASIRRRRQAAASKDSEGTRRAGNDRRPADGARTAGAGEGRVPVPILRIPASSSASTRPAPGTSRAEALPRIGSRSADSVLWRTSARIGADGSGSDGHPDADDPDATDTGPDASGDGPERGSRRDVRRTARARRRYERDEVRRFTRRHRQRRIAGGIAAGLVLLLVGLVAVAVYSPLLALQTIRIEGTERVPADDVLDAVDGQLGTPLALLDLDEVEERLGDFPLIRSYVTETMPPHTLVIHVVERQPIGALPDGDGVAMVDPAGVVVERAAERPAGVPLIDIGDAGVDSDAFDAAVEVLVALPDPVLAELESITATTIDDVRLRLVDQGPEIAWGSAARSDYKARVLEKALRLDLTGVSEINVSAPGQLTLG
jgi:cell division protein FtsQ